MNKRNEQKRKVYICAIDPYFCIVGISEYTYFRHFFNDFIQGRAEMMVVCEG